MIRSKSDEAFEIQWVFLPKGYALETSRRNFSDDHILALVVCLNYSQMVYNYIVVSRVLWFDALEF
jgi:hypothetical protein